MSFLFPTKSKDQIKVFRLWDTLTFGGIAFIASVILGYFFVNAENIDLQGRIGLVATGLMFWLPYVMFLLARAKWIKKISFVTKHGLPVITNGFPVKKEDIEEITDHTIQLWDSAVPWSQSGTAIQTLFIEFKEFPLTDNRDTNRKFAGLLKNKWAIIGYKEDLHVTALDHELGHEIHYALTGSYDNEGCHEYMRTHGLP